MSESQDREALRMKAFGIECPDATDDEFVTLVAAAKTGDPAARDDLLLASLPLAQAVVRCRHPGTDACEVLAMLAHTIYLSIPLFDETRGAKWRSYVVGRCIHRMRAFRSREQDARDRLHDLREGASQSVLPEEIAEDPSPVVRAALAELDARQRTVIEGHFYRGLSLRSLSAEMGISFERVRQIETGAFQKLATALKGVTV